MTAAAATLHALALLRERLSATEHALQEARGDAGFLEAVADVDRALTAFAVTVGLERRAAVSRRRVHPRQESLT